MEERKQHFLTMKGSIATQFMFLRLMLLLWKLQPRLHVCEKHAMVFYGSWELLATCDVTVDDINQVLLWLQMNETENAVNTSSDEILSILSARYHKCSYS